MYDGKRLILHIFWIVLGAVLLVLSIAEVLDSSLYAGMGGALMAVGVVRLIGHIRYRRNAEYRNKIDAEVSDERNSFLRMKSWSWTGYIVVLAEAVGVVVSMILGQQTVMRVLSYSVCLIVGAYWIIYVILSKKY